MTEDELKAAFAQAFPEDTGPMVTVYKASKRNLGRLPRKSKLVAGMVGKSKYRAPSLVAVGRESGGLQTMCPERILAPTGKQTTALLLENYAAVMELFKTGHVVKPIAVTASAPALDVLQPAPKPYTCETKPGFLGNPKIGRLDVQFMTEYVLVDKPQRNNNPADVVRSKVRTTWMQRLRVK